MIGKCFWQIAVAVICVLHVTESIPIDNGLVLSNLTTIVIDQGGEGRCAGGGADLALVVDGSTSIGKQSFNLVKEFLVKIVESFSRNGNLRVGMVQFSGSPKVEFNLKTFGGNEEEGNDVAKVKNKLKGIRWKMGTTGTGKAIEKALRDILDHDKGDRPGVPDVFILFTDGRSTDDISVVKRAAAKLHNRPDHQQTVIVIGVTKAVVVEELNIIAGSCPGGVIPKDDPCPNVFLAKKFEDLNEEFISGLVGSFKCEFVTSAPVERVVTLDEAGLEMTCETDRIVVGSKTRNPFKGRVFVKGYYDKCFQEGDGVDTYAGKLEIPFDSCGSKILRQNEGVVVENMVTFQFHENVQTKVDQSYKVECFYMDATKPVNINYGVSPITTLSQRTNFRMPTCSYSVRETDDPNSLEVKFALVGQKVHHHWVCVDDKGENIEGLFKIRVHDCQIQNEGEAVQLLDTVGCSIDQFLLQQPDYSTDGLKAHVQSHVFKFADKVAISFQCQVSICADFGVSEDVTLQTCEGYPPTEESCSGLAPGGGDDYVDEVFFRKRRSLTRETRSLSRDRLVYDVLSEDIFVADQTDVDYVLDSNGKFAPYTDNRSQGLKDARGELIICLTNLEIFLFVTLSLGGFILSAALTVAIHMKASSKEKVDFRFWK